MNAYKKAILQAFIKLQADSNSNFIMQEKRVIFKYCRQGIL